MYAGRVGHRRRWAGIEVAPEHPSQKATCPLLALCRHALLNCTCLLSGASRHAWYLTIALQRV